MDPMYMFAIFKHIFGLLAEGRHHRETHPQGRRWTESSTCIGLWRCDHMLFDRCPRQLLILMNPRLVWWENWARTWEEKGMTAWAQESLSTVLLPKRVPPAVSSMDLPLHWNTSTNFHATTRCDLKASTSGNATVNVRSTELTFCLNSNNGGDNHTMLVLFQIWRTGSARIGP